MITLRHRAASGDLRSIWEFDPARRVVDIVLETGAAFTVAVCAIDAPRADAYGIARISPEGRWAIQPAVFVLGRNGIGREALVIREQAIAEGLNAGYRLILADAPPDVDCELLELSL